ncbi:MAG: NAD-dependent succinate-semialdehyde dehydrogenase [Burkholderiaceae bacterium]|nr:NAD-dependent succinate-semialdehyde dehydrogenase [Burkholderiaceae bacterium]
MRTGSNDLPSVHQFIGGQWCEGTGVHRQLVIDPSTELPVAELRHASDADVDQAIAAAQAAFAGWRDTPAIERSRLLHACAAHMRQRKGDISRLIGIELGKPLAQGLAEVETAAEIFDWAAEETRRSYGRVIPARAGLLQQRTELVPVGVVAALSGWNAPAITPSRKLSTALAAGCTIVLKPSEETPRVALALVQAMHDAGIPPGVANLVMGDPEKIAKRMIESGLVRAISFTGGTEVGRQLGAMAGAQLKRMTLELGGHAPVLVFDDVDIERVARGAVLAKYRNAGQVCTSPTRFCIHASVYSRFVEVFVAETRRLVVGGPDRPGVHMGPLKNLRRVEAMERFAADARHCGVEIAAGGSRLAGPGYFFEPTVLLDPQHVSAAANMEPFGPIAVLQPFDTMEEAVREANRLPVGLAAYAFTRDLGRAHELARAVNCGSLAINDWAVSAAETPFGGVLDSGMGVEGGSEGLREFQQVKTVRTGSTA